MRVHRSRLAAASLGAALLLGAGTSLAWADAAVPGRAGGPTPPIPAPVPTLPPTITPTPSGPDITPPSRPGDIAPRIVYLNNAAGLSWTPSTDDDAVAGYQVYVRKDGAFSRANVVMTNVGASSVTATVGDLAGNRDYLFYVVAVDAAGNLSEPSDLVTARAMVEPPAPLPSPGPDMASPTAPYGVGVAGGLSVPGGVTLYWSQSSDPGGSAIRYDVYHRTPTGYQYDSENSIPRAIVSGLVGGRPYTFQIVARDTAGNLSAPSAPFTAVAQPETPPAPCGVVYSATTWPGGFTTSVKITNLGVVTVSGWKLAFSFPLAEQRLTGGWSAIWTQSGKDVTAAAPDWNKDLDPGESVYAGFYGTYTGENPAPASFTLNGTTCAPR
ncbi:cellulose binding domain-containing protein [Sphaerisporangium dianthi]|uniref:Cellulose binding domain-containing protein n=1 Tax=Sphaerisporangium dianthi TaxID=1436120 RepID=A0ABV9CMQ7_9ACTN